MMTFPFKSDQSCQWPRRVRESFSSLLPEERLYLDSRGLLELHFALSAHSDDVPHQVLWQVPDTAQAVLPRQLFTGDRSLRIDPATSEVASDHLSHEALRGQQFQWCFPRELIFRIDGILEARQQFGGTDWLVVVVPDDQLDRLRERELAYRISEFNRLLVLRHFGEEVPSRTETENVREFARLGGTLTQAFSSSNSQTLTLHTQRDIQEPPGDRLSALSRTELHIITEEVSQLAAEHLHLRTIHLDHELRRSVTEEVFPHLAGTMSAGCHPVVVLSNRLMREQIEELREFCDRTRGGITFVVQSPEAGKSALRQGEPLTSLAYLNLLPSALILEPSHRAEFTQMLELSVALPKPSLILLPENGSLELSPGFVSAPLAIGQADLLRQGSDLALIASGASVIPALRAATQLALEGIDTTVINTRFYNPLDSSTLKRLARIVPRIAVLDERSTSQGLSQLVSKALIAEDLNVSLTAFSSPDAPLRTDQIVDRVRSWILTRSPFSPAERDYRQIDHTKPILHERFGFHSAKIKAEQTAICETSLSPWMWHWHELYAGIGKRPPYLWQWCSHGIDLTTLPCVGEAERELLRDAKLLSVILCVIYDDIADETEDVDLLKLLLEIPKTRYLPSHLKKFSSEVQHQAKVTWMLWEDYFDRVESLPNYAEYQETLEYDLDQFFNMMRYANLMTRHPWMTNLAEHDSYMPHNMLMVSFSTLDLMCADYFPAAELGQLRQSMFHAQSMGRIGNLLSTWRRELKHQDFSSGVFIRAMIERDVTFRELMDGEPGELEQLIQSGDHEQYFFEKWQDHKFQLETCARRISSLDLSDVIKGHERFLGMHLGCQNLI